MYTKAQLRAMRTPKGGNPFSAPQLFARGRKKRSRAPRAQPNARRVDAPVATTSILRGNTGPANRTMPLIRREFIGDINGSVAFATTQYSLNPALTATFPWGGQIASSFEEYDTVSISFCYEPESSSASTGAIILSFDYDALDDAPGTKQAALEMADSIRAAPWVPCKLVLKQPDLRKRGTLFTRVDTVANSDLKTYDLGNLHVSTVGQDGSTVIGELWIEYHFILRTPQTAPSASTPSSSFLGQKIVGVSPSPTSLFGTSPTITGSSPVATATVNTITFTTAGEYLVTAQATGGNSSNLPTPSTTGSTCTLTTLGQSTGTATAWTVGVTSYIVTATVGQTLVINYTSQAATLTASITRIMPYTYALG